LIENIFEYCSSILEGGVLSLKNGLQDIKILKNNFFLSQSFFKGGIFYANFIVGKIEFIEN
jgi:hypothetical protein